MKAEYFIGIYTADGQFIQLKAFNNEVDAENMYKNLKREIGTLEIVGVNKEDLLAISLNKTNYREGKLTGTERIRTASIKF